MKGICIADLHMDAIPIENLKKELPIFLDTIKETESLDLIVFCGDLFDKKIFLNNEWVDFIMKFIHQVVKLAKERDIKIRMIYGTESHESDQYGIFDMYKTESNLDFKIFYTVTEETIGDCHILYVPEEYMVDKSEFYKDFFTKKKYYDYVFGHGVIQDIMTMVHSHSNKRMSVPIFTSGELQKICKGDVFFGHYHVHKSMKNVHYIGSFSRWKQGEDEEKGFYLFEKEKKEYRTKFITNVNARTYKTVLFGYDHTLFRAIEPEEITKELQTVKNLIERSNYDFLRIIFNIPEEYPNSELLIDMIRGITKKYKEVSCEFVNGYISKKRNISEDTMNEFLSKYDYIIENKNIRIEDKLSMYIQDKYEKFIDPKDVKKYLDIKIEDILKETE